MQHLSNKKLSKYFLYAIGEIFLVVIGILIALQINNWNNQRLEDNKEMKTYQAILQQIEEDRLELIEKQAFNKIKMGELLKANEIIGSNNRIAIDTLAYLVMMMSQYSDFLGNGNIYETLVNSGDIKLIKSTEVPARIKKLENTYIFINRLEDIHWSIIIDELSPELKGVMNFDSFEKFKPDRILQPDRLYTPELQNIVYEVKYLSIGKDTIYGRALRQIDHITRLIDAELENNMINTPGDSETQ